MREKGSGFAVVDGSDPSLMANASHIARFASRERLESALGAFQPAGGDRAGSARSARRSRPAPSGSPVPVASRNSYRRDPNRRADRREERAAARGQLYAEFLKARGGRERYAAAWERQRARERTRYADITAQKRADRDRLISLVGAQAARTIAAAVAAHKREDLRGAIELEREDLRSSFRAERAVSWREFVTERALGGDEAAISALRGLRYQDGRERRRAERDGFSAQGGASEPRTRSFSGLAYQVQRSGAVAFYRANDPQRTEQRADRNPHSRVGAF